MKSLSLLFLDSLSGFLTISSDTHSSMHPYNIALFFEVHIELKSPMIPSFLIFEKMEKMY